MPGEIQTSYTSGALDPKMRGRFDAKHYYNGAEVLRNIVVSPLGGAAMRPGLEYMAKLQGLHVKNAGGTYTMPNGGTVANVTDDDFSTNTQTTVNVSTTNPYVVAQFDNGSLFQYAALVGVSGLSLTSGSSTEFELQGSTDGVAWFTSYTFPTVDQNQRNVCLTLGPSPTSSRYFRIVRIGATDLGTAKVNLAEFYVSTWNFPLEVGNVKMIPFEFDLTTRYLLVLTQNLMSVFLNGVLQAELFMPYTDAEVAAVNWTQSLDTLLLVHEDHPPLRLIHDNAVEWIVDAQPFVKVPKYAFAPVTSNPVANITPDTEEGAGKLTASAAVFTSAHVDQQIEGGGGLIRITEYVSTTVVKYVTLFPFFNLDVINSGNWTLTTGFEDAWSSTRGWPRSITFHEARTVIGGSRSLPSTVWMSRVGLFFDFDLGQFLDDDGIDVTINADEQPIIHNVRSGNTLQILASTGEWFVPQANEQPITPSTVSLRHTGSRGSEPGIRTADIDGETLFIQRLGKAVREFVFDEADQKYSSTNISLLATHLINSPVAMAARKSTSSDEADLLGVVNGDGTLALLTTLRDQDVTAWSLCDTTAMGGEFRGIGVDLDDVYFAVRRNSPDLSAPSEVLYLERFNDAVRTDAADLRLNQTGTVFNNYNHLGGNTLKVVVDGGMYPDEVLGLGSFQIVISPSITNATLEVGLPYTWEIIDMPVIRELPDGTKVDGKKRVHEIMLELFETKNILIDGERATFPDASGVDQDPSSTSVIVLPYTGRKVREGRLGWDDQAQVTLSGDLPLPATVLLQEKRLVT